MTLKPARFRRYWYHQMPDSCVDEGAVTQERTPRGVSHDHYCVRGPGAGNVAGPFIPAMALKLRWRVEPGRDGWTFRVDGLPSRAVRVIARAPAAGPITAWLVGK